MIIDKYSKYKKQYKKDQETVKSFTKLYRKFLKDNEIHKIEYESLCNYFTKYVDEMRNKSFL